MNRRLLIPIIIIALFCIYFAVKCSGSDYTGNQSDTALNIQKNSVGVDNAVDSLMINYYALTTSFNTNDTVSINKAAAKFALSADSLPVLQLKGDSTLIETAESFAKMLSAESAGLLGEVTLDNKRRSLYTISDNLFNFLRTIRYNKNQVYYVNTPDAFGNAENAYFLSESKQFNNPYFEKNSPKVHQGNIEDSILKK